MLSGITVRTGNASVVCKLRGWVRAGRCALLSSAASGLVADIQQLPSWLSAYLYFAPFHPPASFEEAANQRDCETELLLRMSDHFRSVVVPRQGEQWRLQLPRAPVTTDEPELKLERNWHQDELRPMERLADLGTASAQIIAYSELTRAVGPEAFKQLGAQRRLQVNLAEILGATRYKILIKGLFCPATRPRTYCFARDTFDHVLECYNLADRVERGPNATPFPVQMAKVALLPPRGRRIPIMTDNRQ